MIDYVIEYFIVVAALLSVQYGQAVLFTMFRADRYEDTLARKVASEVNKTLAKSEKIRRNL